jgi:response regulator RpfG family c-di-GMP phosphodiesterase
MTNNKSWTLMVIDNNIDTVHYLKDVLANKPYEIISTNNGEEGFKLLLNQPELYSAILLGQNIDQINGLKLLHRINSSSTIKSIPVIIEASTGSMEETEICIRAGARYCIPKPFEDKIMPQIIATAIRDQNRYSTAEQGVLTSKPIGSLIKAEFKLQNLTEAQAIANLIAGECPNPRLAAVGITEMLINAIEHGNLGITYAEKTKLHEKEEWLAEIERRLIKPENKDKYVQVVFDKSSSHINIRITDQGDGFNWREYQTLDTKRVYDNHGRGIVMARSLTFESLIYHDKGNDVECIIPLTL